MKSLKLFTVLSIIIFLVMFEGISIVHAQTLTKDFGETIFNSSDGGVFCKIDVTATVQTDPNYDWIKNHTYQINWFIQITYLNQSTYNTDDFSIVCYNPENPVQEAVTHRVVNESTSVTAQQNAFGYLAMTFTPQNASTSFQLDSSFSLKVYYKGSIVTSGSWLQSSNNQPINIDVLNNQTNPSPTVPELTHLALGVAFVVVTGSLVVYRVIARQNSDKSTDGKNS